MINHEYETIYVSRPELPEEEQKRLFDKLNGIIDARSGSLLIKEDWGTRKLAYAIQKHSRGQYIYINYTGPADLPGELERNIRIEDNLIRFLTVRLGENVDVESARVAAEERHRKRLERMAAQAAEDAAAEAAAAAYNRGDRRDRDDDDDADDDDLGDLDLIDDSKED